MTRRPQRPPIHLICEAFALDPDAPTGLRWRERPRAHFVADHSWRFWLRRYAGRPVSGSPNGRGGAVRVGLMLGGKQWTLPVLRVAYVLKTGAWPSGHLRRGIAP
jgi:hypothetical protein